MAGLPQTSRKHKAAMLCVLAAVIVLIVGLTSWPFKRSRPTYSSLPPSQVAAQHVYTSDNNDTVVLVPYQHLIFDVGDMSAWGRPRISTVDNQMMQLSIAVFASPDDGGQGTISF